MFEIKVSNDILLREVEMTDAASIFAIINSDREYLRRWLPFVDFTTIVEDTEQFIKDLHSAPTEKKEFVFAIVNNNQLSGIIGFRNTDRTNHKTEIGYWLAEKEQGQGIASKACLALINLAFVKMNMNRVQIRVAIENERSKAIPKRLGFYYEGIERDGEFLNGSFTDLEVYSMLKKDWLHESHPEKDN